MLDFDEWYALWETDIEEEFKESGYIEHNDFCEERYMSYISQDEDDLTYSDLDSCHTQQTSQEVLGRSADLVHS